MPKGASAFAGCVLQRYFMFGLCTLWPRSTPVTGFPLALGRWWHWWLLHPLGKSGRMFIIPALELKSGHNRTTSKPKPSSSGMIKYKYEALRILGGLQTAIFWDFLVLCSSTPSTLPPFHDCAHLGSTSTSSPWSTRASHQSWQHFSLAFWHCFWDLSCRETSLGSDLRKWILMTNQHPYAYLMHGGVDIHGL